MQTDRMDKEDIKMNKLSKLTALLLALVLALGVPMQVMAEGEEIETKTKYYEVADQILQDMIQHYEQYGEYLDFISLIETKDYYEFWTRLTEDEQQKLSAYIVDMFWASCISYTNVAPLKPPVDISSLLPASPFSLTSRAVSEDTTEGLYLGKTAVPNTGDDEGTYTITLDAYVTGNVTKVETPTPADVVLVLDVSGSMKENFDTIVGDYWWEREDRDRLEALQDAVCDFVDSIHAENTNEEMPMNHRISIVKFSTGSSVVQDWVVVDNNNVDEIKRKVNNLNHEGGTEIHLGMQEAYNQLYVPANYQENLPAGNVERSQVVVVFTDGQPAWTSFAGDFAESAINTAGTIKEKGATVYSVAIYPQASPQTSPVWTNLQNATVVQRINAICHAISSNYEDAYAVGTGDGGKETNTAGTLTIYPGDPNPDVNPSVQNGMSYYLTAASKDDLTKIFDAVTNSMTGGTTSTLTQTTVVKDVMSDYFVLPDGFDKSSVTVQTALYNGESAAPQWTVEDTLPFTPEIEFGVDEATGNDYVTVKNFDYAANFVSETGRDPNDPNKEGTFKGRKLIISFKVEPTDGFLGGNNVVTNDPSSGIYQPGTDEDGNPTLEPVEKFPEPVVDVDVPDLEIIGADQHIYLSNLADLDALLHSFQVQYWIKEGDSKYGIYTVDTILNHYTTLTFTLKDEQGNAVATYTIQAGKQTGTWTYNTKDYPSLQLPFEKDTTFYVSYEAISSNDSSNKSVGTLKATIYVYKPEVTFKDTQHDYLADLTAEQVTNYFDDENYVVTERKWYNESLRQYSTALQYMNGPEPDLIFTYAPVSATENNVIITPNEDGSGVISAVQCVPVNVKKVVAKSTYKDYSMDENNGPVETIVATNELNVSKVVKSYRQEISCDCAYDTPENKITDVLSDTVYEFVVHIKNAFSELKIIKKGLSVGESAIFTVTGYVPNGTAVGEQKTWTVVLTKAFANAEPSVTITGLLVDSTATVEEAGNWSWRYQTTQYEPSTQSVEIKPKTESTATITITNTNKNNQWLDDEVAVHNNFDENGTVTVID